MAMNKTSFLLRAHDVKGFFLNAKIKHAEKNLK